uniref:PAM2 domain-containing protein n=1 Tax=Caenorhabditis tropicalis TaxID=1561998 RepID=A0A1I7TEA9_9PELO
MSSEKEKPPVEEKASTEDEYYGPPPVLFPAYPSVMEQEPSRPLGASSQWLPPAPQNWIANINYRNNPASPKPEFGIFHCALIPRGADIPGLPPPSVQDPPQNSNQMGPQDTAKVENQGGWAQGTVIQPRLTDYDARGSYQRWV